MIDLDARVVRLERAARRDRALAVGALAIALATAQAPRASGPAVVRDASGASATLSASGITVRASGNTIRLAAGIDRDGYPSLDEYDSGGLLRQSMYLLSDRPVFRQFDKAGKRRGELFLASDTQNGEYVIRDASEVARLGVFRGAQGLPELAIYGTDGKVRTYLATDDDAPYLVMKDGTGTTRVVVGAYTGGRIGMDVRNAAGTAIWSRP